MTNPHSFFTDRDATAPSLESIDFNADDIKNAIKELRGNAAAGPDNIPAVLLKECADQLAKPLYLLWSKSLRTGKIPAGLKKAIITPIFKGGARSVPKNYRPIALTSHLIKIFEKIVVKNLAKFLEENGHMNENQHGFRAKRSCLSQLIAHYELILEALESNAAVDVIYLDFSKAFDKVDHGILMQKLKKYNMTGELSIWIHNFLLNRTQQVTVEKCLSTESQVISGVPQGSVLGPLLFLILLADIDQDVSSSAVSSFADDTRFLKKIEKLLDTLLLQKDLNTVYEWSKTNNMVFNSEKFEGITYTASSSNTVPHTYQADDGSEITMKKHIKDLGVTMSNDAGFKEHIKTIVQTAKNKMGWILRTFRTRDKLCMLTLWKSLVRPILDYCCQLWSPTNIGLIQDIESLQRTFTSKIDEVRHLNYWQRLEELKLYSLERRRERYTIIYIWKILNNHVPNIGITTRQSDRRGPTCNVRPILTRARGSIKTKISASLLVRGCQLFNEMHPDIRKKTGGSVLSFKNIFDKHLSQT